MPHRKARSDAQESPCCTAGKALRRCGRGSSAKRNIISGHAGKRYFTICERIMRYPEKYARKYGKPHIRKPEEFQAVPATCFLTFQDVFSSSVQLPDGASHTVTGWRYKMGPKPLCFIVNILSLYVISHIVTAYLTRDSPLRLTKAPKTNIPNERICII